MDVVLDPAVSPGLVGIAAVLACALGTAWLMGVAWAKARMLGRGNAPAPVELPRTTPRQTAPDEGTVAQFPKAATICQRRAIEERRAAFARPVALAELHAEVAAIRRDERIFGDAGLEDEIFVLTPGNGKIGCRFLGLSGQPTCPATTGGACRDGGTCTAFAPPEGSTSVQGAEAGRQATAVTAENPSPSKIASGRQASPASRSLTRV